MIADEVIFPVKYIEQTEDGSIVGYIVKNAINVIPIGQPEAPDSLTLGELGMLDLVLIFESAEPTDEVEMKELQEYNDILKQEVKNRARNQRKKARKKK